MHFPLKIQPIIPEWATATSKLPQPSSKSRLKWLFDHQFPSAIRGGDVKERDQIQGESWMRDLEPSSVCLARMVQNFLEESINEKPSRYYCFHGCCDGASDVEPDAPKPSEVLKSLVLCASAAESVLLADITRIVEKIKFKADGKVSRKLLADGLVSLGYDACTCKSCWEENSSFSAGGHEYVDVILDGGQRLLIEIDFRSEFEIAWPDRAYREVVQMLPVVFVGMAERMQHVVMLVTEAARKSMKKKEMHVPPWRKYKYMRSKWFSEYERTKSSKVTGDKPTNEHGLWLEKPGGSSTPRMVRMKPTPSRRISGFGIL